MRVTAHTTWTTKSTVPRSSKARAPTTARAKKKPPFRIALRRTMRTAGSLPSLYVFTPTGPPCNLMLRCRPLSRAVARGRPSPGWKLPLGLASTHAHAPSLPRSTLVISLGITRHSIVESSLDCSRHSTVDHRPSPDTGSARVGARRHRTRARGPAPPHPPPPFFVPTRHARAHAAPPTERACACARARPVRRPRRGPGRPTGFSRGRPDGDRRRRGGGRGLPRPGGERPSMSRRQGGA